MTAYYNENNAELEGWLYELMAAGAIAPGVVDTRSIVDVRPSDLKPFTQCHFFAGIGVWSYALRLAGWPDDRRVWTGSCPCQPFSAAGKGAGFADERHLWPAWFHLITQLRPDRVYGEQVASKDGLAWLDLVHADLEAAGYACGPVDLCAAGVGGPHIRQRLWFVADAEHGGRSAWHSQRAGAGSVVPSSGSGDMGNAPSGRLGEFGGALVAGEIRHPDRSVVVGRLADGSSERPDGRGPVPTDRRTAAEPQGLRALGGTVDDAHVAPAVDPFQAGRAVHGSTGSAGGTVANDERSGLQVRGDADLRGADGRPQGGLVEQPGDGGRTFWSECDWIPCRDGKARPVEPGTFPLAHGAPARVVRLRAYGNAIVAEAAAEMIRATLP